MGVIRMIVSDSSESGSRATAMNSSSSVLLPCSPGSVFGLPSSSTRPCERNSTRSHTTSTSYMLCDVHNTLTRVSVVIARIFARTSLAVAGSRDAVGSSSNRSRGSFSIAFANDTRVCSPDDSTPHFVRRNLTRSNCSSSALMRCPRDGTLYSIPKNFRFCSTVRLPGSGA